MVVPPPTGAMVVRLEPDVDDDEEAFTYSEWLSILGVSDAAGIKGGGPARLTERCVNRQDAECDAGIKPLASEPPPEPSADVNLDSSFEPGPGQNWLHQELGSLQRQLEYANEALASERAQAVRLEASLDSLRASEEQLRGELRAEAAKGQRDARAMRQLQRREALLLSQLAALERERDEAVRSGEALRCGTGALQTALREVEQSQLEDRRMVRSLLCENATLRWQGAAAGEALAQARLRQEQMSWQREQAVRDEHWREEQRREEERRRGERERAREEEERRERARRVEEKRREEEERRRAAAPAPENGPSSASAGGAAAPAHHACTRSAPPQGEAPAEGSLAGEAASAAGPREPPAGEERSLVGLPSRTEQRGGASAPFGSPGERLGPGDASSCMERRLTALSQERGLLQCELERMPLSAGRSNAERKRKLAVESRIAELSREVSDLRLRLKAATALSGCR